MRSRHRLAGTAMSAIVVASLGLAGCSTAQTDSASDSQVADVAAAEDFLQQWNDESAASLLIDESLSTAVSAETRVAFLDQGTPVNALMYERLNEATDLLGITLERIDVGTSADSINAAMNTVVESQTDIVVDVAIDPTFFESQVEQLLEAGVAVVTASVMNATDFGLDESVNGQEWMWLIGQTLASVAVVRTEGTADEFVFYNVPEFTFSAYILQGVQEQMDVLCSECTLRVVDIPVADIGTTAADHVVSDLQANPDTAYFMAAVDEVQIGLPQKLSLAGLDVGGVGLWSNTTSFEQIEAGEQDASLSVDLGLLMWTLLDEGLRQLSGQSYTWPDVVTRVTTLTQVTTPDNLPDDQEVGVVKISDYQEQFAENWLVG